VFVQEPLVEQQPGSRAALSLSFIDKVANYRDYDEKGNPRPGKYAVMFGEEYTKQIRKPKYRDLLANVADRALISKPADSTDSRSVQLTLNRFLAGHVS
jgi:restriction endonuclease